MRTEAAAGAVASSAAPALDPAVDPALDPGVERDRLDTELVDLLCQDPHWVDEAFWGIVAADEGEPPRGGGAPLAARPRRSSPRRRTAQGSEGAGRSQWSPRPVGRQRSPPVSAGR